MYRAKELGGSRYEMFDEALRCRSLRRLEVEQELRLALERGEFRNVYQPLVAADGESIVGFEALVRWEHPEHGTIPPLDFIYVAEETGLIVPIGSGVLEHACREAVGWDSLGGAPLGISVNLSPRQVSDPALVETVARVLADTGLDPARLSLEITETALINDADACGAVLRQLKTLGVNLVLDDFGTGYSSLSHAKHFPIDTLKIDRSFVNGLCDDAEDSAIVSAVISMGRALGIAVVAEGVETAEQAVRLRNLGCPFAQGYHFARPADPAAVRDLLARR
jgi:EAL domain-containing protein (putative c-di-GMP-specific phosphodiesterase class I)